MTEENQGISVEKEITVITDAFLSKEVYGKFEGFKFVCPNCHIAAIMVNEDMKGTVCFNCLSEVKVVSNTVNRFRENLQKLKDKETER